MNKLFLYKAIPANVNEPLMCGSAPGAVQREAKASCIITLRFALLRSAVRNYALRSAGTAARVWRFFDLTRGLNHVVCVDPLSVLIKWTRRAACTSLRRRRWELCAQALQFSPDWSHARCGRIRAKQKDTREGRKPPQSSGRDCVKSDEEEDEEAVRTL